jgi:vacuolar-type H+-ATPase subunit I/STV1
MSGYVPRERERLTREQWIAMVLAIVMGILMMFIALYASRVAMGWIGTIGKIPPGAPVMFILGSTLLIQSGGKADEGEPVRPGARFRRIYAFILYGLGAAALALPFVFGGQR